MTEQTNADLIAEARDRYSMPWHEPADYDWAKERAEFDRMIEAVRAEERERAAQIAENLYFGGGATGSANRWGAKRAAARIREEQDA